MLVLSIDVGIKNLGFCLFEVKDNKDFEIVEWNSINLLENQEFICNYKSEKNKKCVCKAKFEKNNEHYCKKHAKIHSNYIIPNNELNPTQYKRLKLNELIELKNKFNIPIDSEIKLTKSIIIEYFNTYINEKYFNLINESKSSEVDLVVLGINLMKQFDFIFKPYHIQKVIIENQISPIANRMKTIQGMIAQYFIMNHIQDIHFLSSFNKLKLWVNKKTTYNERKKISVLIVKQLLNNNNNIHKWENIFVSHKKKDDLADSFLQGLWYLHDKNKIHFNKDVNLN